MYNQFVGVVESEGKDYNSELNNVFSNFLSNGINDLVVDLRYNPGGRISTSINLASMITGQFNNQVFAKERWNSKLMNYWDENNPESLLNRFTNKLSNNQSIFSLNLNRVFILMYAMQPIVLKIGNVAGYTDFPDGLEPDILIKESLLNPGILGDINEPLLKIAIDQITGDASSIDNDFQFKEISSPLDVLKERIIIDDNDIE